MRDLNYYIENILFQPIKNIWRRLSSVVKLSWLFLIIFATLPSNAHELTSHYIIAFDQSVPLYRNEYLSRNVIQTLDKILAENDFKQGKDYISIVGYSLEHTPSMERFVRPYKDSKNNDILWKQYEHSLSNNLANWPNGQPMLNLDSGSPSSMQSLAKPYAIMETKGKGDSIALVDRTILILVTDEVVNGRQGQRYRGQCHQVQETDQHACIRCR